MSDPPTDIGHELMVDRPDGPGREQVRVFDASTGSQNAVPFPLPKASRRGRAGSAAPVAARLAAALSKRSVEKEPQAVIEGEEPTSA
jgi:hypothetical protein